MLWCDVVVWSGVAVWCGVVWLVLWCDGVVWLVRLGGVVGVVWCGVGVMV